jgi:hypothetical protein
VSVKTIVAENVGFPVGDNDGFAVGENVGFAVGLFACERSTFGAARPLLPQFCPRAEVGSQALPWKTNVISLEGATSETELLGREVAVDAISR